jgi:thermitase
LPNIKAPGAWDIERGSRDIKIAVLDSGFDNGHPDLSSYIGCCRVVGQKDFVNNDNNASDDHGHGTATTGVAAATTNNSRGVAGVCPNCSLLIAKVLDKNIKLPSYDTLAAGVDWAVGQRANVINMSLKMAAPNPAVETAIHRAWTQGAVVVAATGNEGTDNVAVYPAAYPDVIAVAATGGGNPFTTLNRDSRAIYPSISGNYCYRYSISPDGIRYCGRRVGASNAGYWVDVAAPGKDNYTTTWCGYKCTSYANAYGYWFGTSFAAPHVSGLAGLIFSKGGHEGHPVRWSPTDVRKRIESTVRDLGTPGKDPVYGHGVINAQAAVRCLPSQTTC